MTDTEEPVAERQRWMRVLARATTSQLTELWETWDPKPRVDDIRAPEVGLVMVRGRVGGGGDRFNLGEATVTRATVRVGDPDGADTTVGTAYVLGNDLRRAWLAAVFDALLAGEERRETLLADVIAPLERGQIEQDEARRAEARSTKVDFLTVAREN